MSGDDYIAGRVELILQRFANIARGRLLLKFMLISFMFNLLIICLDNTKAAMGYNLLLVAGDISINKITADQNN